MNHKNPWCLLTLQKMIKNKFSEIVYSESDLIDSVMQGKDIVNIPNIVIDHTVDLDQLVKIINDTGEMLSWKPPGDDSVSVAEFDASKQSQWFMPAHYQDIDIAAHVLSLCKTDAELQRVGQELLLFQEKNMFNILKYMKYLVDIMNENRVIWGVGRGSSVASYVLYLLGVHKINSMFYELDPEEFLR